MSDTKKTIEVTCPHCNSILRVDAATGEVIVSKKKEKRQFESLEKVVEVAREKEKEKKGLFEKALELEKKRKELLEKKFKEAKELSTDDETPPPNPFEFD